LRKWGEHREGVPKGWSTALITALGSWGKPVPRGHPTCTPCERSHNARHIPCWRSSQDQAYLGGKLELHFSVVKKGAQVCHQDRLDPASFSSMGCSKLLLSLPRFVGSASSLTFRVLTFRVLTLTQYADESMCGCLRVVIFCLPHFEQSMLSGAFSGNPGGPFQGQRPRLLCQVPGLGRPACRPGEERSLNVL